MALKDMMRDVAKSTLDAAQGAMGNQAQDVRSQGVGGVVSGLMGNYSELSPEGARQQYGMYLLQGEQFTRCFSLLRDKMLFTDKRIIFVDHQGATGAKVVVESINLNGIVSVSLETGGIGFDKAELEMRYITHPRGEEKTKRLEFPNGFNIQELYCLLEGYAHANTTRMLS